jgi:pyrroloquinoline-quinone synthase
VTTNDLRSVLDEAAHQRRLLDHPFYRAWQAGELTRHDLAEYGAQYRYVEQVLPAVLETTAAMLPVGQARRLVERNLADERSRPRPHLELLEDFALAVGADLSSARSPATTRLVATYQDAAQAGPAVALAVLGTYEVQAAEVAATKAESLRSHYDLGSEGTEFWDVHARLEASHASWTADAMAELRPARADIRRAAAMSAAGWWAFLDERQRWSVSSREE